MGMKCDIWIHWEYLDDSSLIIDVVNTGPMENHFAFASKECFEGQRG